MKPRNILFVILAMTLWAGLAVAARADGAGADGAASAGPLPAAPTWDPWAFDVILRLFGADVGVGYRGFSIVPGDQTTFWAYAGGGYEGEHYYRDANGNLLTPGSISSSGGSLANGDPTFNRIEGAWRLGIQQGLAWNPRISDKPVRGVPVLPRPLRREPGSLRERC